MKRCFTLFLLLAVFLWPAQAETETSSQAANADVLLLEPWQKRPLLMEYSFWADYADYNEPLNKAATEFDVLYHLGSDQFAGLGFGYGIVSPTLTFNLTGIGRYYLPAELSRWLELPLSRFYLETRLGLGQKIARSSREFLFFLNPLLGFETRYYSFATRLAAGLELNYDPSNSWQLAPSWKGGIGLSITFEDYDTSAYEAELARLNQQPPQPSFRMSFGAGVPEGLGWTTWFLSPEWGLGFFKGLGDEPLFPQVGLVLRRYFTPVRFGGSGYLEAVLSTSHIRAGGLRLGYEYRLASWLHIEGSLGAGLLAANSSPNIQSALLGSLGLGITLPLPQADSLTGN